MKRLLAFVLLIAMICSVCVFAPSAAALSEEEEALYAKYADLIGLLEAEDFDTALEMVYGLMPAVEYEEVTITTENFFDYYEVVTDDPYIERDSTGAIVSIWPGNLVFKLKEEFYKRGLDWENSSVTAGATAKKTLYRAKIDWETGEITLGDEIDSKVRKELKKIGMFDPTVDQSETGNYSIFLDGSGFIYKHPEHKSWWGGSADPSLGKTKLYVCEYSDVELVMAKGTLFIAKRLAFSKKQREAVRLPAVFLFLFRVQAISTSEMLRYRSSPVTSRSGFSSGGKRISSSSVRSSNLSSALSLQKG